MVLTSPCISLPADLLVANDQDFIGGSWQGREKSQICIAFVL